MKWIFQSVLLLLCLTGCAKINDAGMKLLSTSSPALAIVNETLLVGKSVVYTDRSGTLSLESIPDASFKCMGNFRFTATRSGTTHLKCSDGTDVIMTFNAISETRGFGTGKTSRGPTSFVFGFDPKDANPYLILPAGKRIVIDAEGNSKLEN